MKKIPLTQGQSSLVDDEDFEFLNQFKWYAHWSRHNKAYYATRKGQKQKHILMHRFLMKTPDGMVCDHINHNTLDNQKRNLRNCTFLENAWNKKKYKTNTTGVKGVRFQQGKYDAQLIVRGVVVFRARFETKEEAEAAYEREARKHHGEFYYDEKQAQQ